MPEPTRSPARWQVIAAFAAVYLIWGSTYLAIRIGIESMPPFLMAGARFLMAGGILYGGARLAGTPAPSRIHWRSAVILGALLLLAGNGGLTWAEQTVPSSIAALLLAMVPLWMVLLDWLRPGGVRPGVQVMAGVALGLVGITLLVRPWELGSGAIDLLGTAGILFGSLMWAIGSLYSRGAPRPSSLFLFTGMQMLAGGALLTALGAFTGEWVDFDVSAVSPRSLVALAYLIVFGAIIGYTAYVWLLKVVPAARVSTYAYVNPAVAIFLGAALGDETLTPTTLVAAAVIISAVVIITTFRSREHRPILSRFQPVPEGSTTRI
jgi:drug/metabolite transporter (DMT)-like permease